MFNVNRVLNIDDPKVVKRKTIGLCALCRGTRLLCGKKRCPVIVKFHSRNKIKAAINSLKIDGSSPPSVFIGRQGYPKVFIGPMIPPVMGDTSAIDTPEMWLDKTIEEIVDFRTMLIRGKQRVNVKDVESSDKNVELTRELALAEKSVYAEAVFDKKPRGLIFFHDDAQPHGPSAPLKKIDISNPKYERHIEKAYYDWDLQSKKAIIDLYNAGVKISSIQKAFSVGAFGVKKYRRFVPTRWSITAVDSLIGRELREKTKTYPWINECRVYFLNQFDNRWIVIMFPSEWQYELIEAWYPNTTWNPYSKKVQIFNSYEFYGGRKNYASIGGCYYAARLAVNETLNIERKQAGCIVLREAHPGYIMPLGVWNVRESVRKTLKQPAKKFDTLTETLKYVCDKMDIPLREWINHSALLKNRLHQRKIEDF